MKFLCVECDEPMKFDKTDGMDDDGSMSVTFRCPSCEWGVTMLTNPQETQMVRTLGVQIGNTQNQPEPMDMMKRFVAGHQPGGEPSAGGGKCPFSHVVQQMAENQSK